MKRQICGREQMWPSEPNTFRLAFYGKLADCWYIACLSRKQLLEAEQFLENSVLTIIKYISEINGVGYIGSKTFHEPVARRGYVPSLYFKVVCISDFNLPELPEPRELSCPCICTPAKSPEKTPITSLDLITATDLISLNSTLPHFSYVRLFRFIAVYEPRRGN